MFSPPIWGIRYAWQNYVFYPSSNFISPNNSQKDGGGGYGEPFTDRTSGGGMCPSLLDDQNEKKCTKNLGETLG